MRPKESQDRSPSRKTVALVDMTTGEVLEGTPVLHNKKARLGKDYTMMMLDRLGEIAKDKSLTGESWRVLAFLLSRMDFENWVAVDQTGVAGELNMAQQNVSRAMKNLAEKGLLEKSALAVGKRGLWRISPTLAWRGSVKTYNASKAEEMRAKKQAVRDAGDRNAARARANLQLIPGGVE